jgi:MoxR-like ATPase
MATSSKKVKEVEVADLANLENNTESVKNFVFMEKTVNLLDIGMLVNKNVILYGPGGHGKSELTLAYFAENGITPYVITMGTGMTTDRLFGGLDIPTFNATGKIEYLVDNSFMNAEYVIFEELFDAPDFILEQLKDILSSGIFRNGTQIVPIKTKFIVCCTNRTREEFSKNMSLKALMERFPLEQNVIWNNYTDITYNKLLESKFGEGNVDPVIPYILQEYAKNGITISPRVAVIAYTVFDACGPTGLQYIAEFAKKPTLIADALKKFEAYALLKTLTETLAENHIVLYQSKLDSTEALTDFDKTFVTYTASVRELKSLKVADELIDVHSKLMKEHETKHAGLKKKRMIASTLTEI